MAIDVDAFVDLKEVESGLRRMQLAGHDLTPVFRAVRADLRKDQAQHQKAQRGAEGPWKPLANSTIQGRKQKANKHGRKRATKLRSLRSKLLGRLPRAFDIKISASSIKAISRIKWSGAQQGGGRVGHRAILPPREFLWASTGLLAIVSRKAVDYMVGAWEKK